MQASGEEVGALTLQHCSGRGAGAARSSDVSAAAAAAGPKSGFRSLKKIVPRFCVSCCIHIALQASEHPPVNPTQ